MGNLNVVIIQGYVGSDPIVKTVGEKKVAEFNIATSRGYGDNKETDWHRVVFWEKPAEIVEKYVRTGSEVTVRGSLRYRYYFNRQNERQMATEIIGSELSLCGKVEVKPEVARNTVNFMEHQGGFKIGEGGKRIPVAPEDMPE